MRVFVIALTSFCLAGAAAAQTCTFVSECVNEEPCQATEFDMDVKTSDDYASGTLSSVAGDVETRITNTQAASFYSGYQSDSFHLLTLFKANISKYTVHTVWADDGVLSVTYHGRCV